MDPTKDHTIKALRDAIETSFPDIPIHRRQPFSKTQLRALASTALNWAREGRPQFYRMYVLIILSYKAATRIDELLKLIRRDVLIEKDHFSFNFPSRKNKKRRLASMVFIAKDPDSILCPHATLIEYLRRMEILTRPTNMSEASFEMQYIFPGAYEYVSTGLPTNHITYSTVNDQLAELIVSIGLDSHNYGWHSTRSSAITHMRQAKLSPDTVAAHTGHHDIKSLQTYDQKSTQDRLIPSKIGLNL
jgi:integrase